MQMLSDPGQQPSSQKVHVVSRGDSEVYSDPSEVRANAVAAALNAFEAEQRSPPRGGA